jgi:conjugative transposon TraN protein
MKYVLSILLSLSYGLVYAQKADSSIAVKAKGAASFLYLQTKAYGIRIELKGIYVHNQLFYFNFFISNRSRLNYPIDFIHFYIRDRVTAKRTSVQEIELIPLYIDSVSNVSAKSKQNFVIVLPQFTIPDRKECILELFELNGGRNLRLKVTNNCIFQVRAL